MHQLDIHEDMASSCPPYNVALDRPAMPRRQTPVKERDLGFSTGQLVSRTARTKWASKNIEAKLRGGGVKEASQHFKGWYCAATEVKAWPCFQTIEHQTAKWVMLYTQSPPRGKPLPINITPASIPNSAPSDLELRNATRNLSNGHTGGTLMMHAKPIEQCVCVLSHRL